MNRKQTYHPAAHTLAAALRRWTVVVGALALLLFGATGDIHAQAASGNFRLTSGDVVGGGGASGSANFSLVGCVPLCGAGLSASANLAVGGGFIATLAPNAGMAGYYAGAPLQTVAIADRQLKVAYENPPAAVSGTLHYRAGGASAYTSRAMTAGTGDTMVVTVTADLLGIRGLEYYFTLTSVDVTIMVGDPGGPYIFRTTLNNTAGMRPSVLPDAQYRIVGLPLIPSSSSAANVFVDDLGAADPTQWRLGSFLSSSGQVREYPNVAAVTPGEGYWLIARGGKRYGSAGTSILPNRDHGGNRYYEIALDSGWNMLANPFPFDISVTTALIEYNSTIVIGDPDSLVESAAYYYTGSAYQVRETIPAWEGAFVFVKRPNVSAWICYEEVNKSAPAKPAVPEDPESWAIELRLEAGNLFDAENFAGMHPEALDAVDRFDFSEPPPPPDGPRLAFRLPDSDRLRRVDMRAPNDKGGTWDLDISDGSDRTLVVSGIDNISAEFDAVLALDNGTVISLTDGARVPLPPGVTAARLVVGNRAYLHGEAVSLPTDYTLDQNFPNPFNPITSIHFAIPQGERVQLDVHNILGQKVCALVDDDLQPGEYTVTWAGVDDHGTPVASGIYFYRLKTAGFSQCRKMVLLK